MLYSRDTSGVAVLRIPATAIVRLVIDRLRILLRSQIDLTNLVQLLNLSAGQLRDTLRNAQNLSEQWSAKSASDQRTLLQGVLIKVCLKHDHVELSLSRRDLLQTIMHTTALSPTRSGATPLHHNAAPEYDIFIIQTTNSLEYTGNGLRLIISDTKQSQPNMHLTPLLGEAFMLREALMNGPHNSFEDVSKAFQIGKGHVTVRTWMTYLSPKLIRNFLNGDEPSTLSPTRLLEASKDLPMKWAEQDNFINALAR